MEGMMKKLTLWHTRTFRPITNHEELEPILTALGFEPLSLNSPTGPIVWKEYSFHAADRDKIPRPRLPFPRIDGLHLLTYRAFIESVGFYIGVHLVADHFHVRGMPLHKVHDRMFDKVFRPIRDERRMSDEDCIYVFREGTLDQTTLLFCNGNNNNNNNGSYPSNNNNNNGSYPSNNNNNNGSSNNTTNNNSIFLVPLKDIIPLKYIAV